MENDDPIREEKTIFEKFRELGKKLFKKPPKHKDYFVSPYEVEAQERLNKNLVMMGDAWRKFGMTTEEAGRRIAHFSEILTPNEMRDLIERRKQWKN